MSEEKAIQKPSLGGTSIVAGARPTAKTDFGISRLVLFQGSAEEVEMYGEGFKRGQFLDELERVSLGTKVRIAVIGAWATYAKFVKGQKAPIYSYRGWDSVPEKHRPDFDWSGPEGKTAPTGTESINAICAVQTEAGDVLPSPFLFVFKRTSMGAWKGKQGIERYDARFGPCLHELSSTTDKNPEGKPYQRLTSRMVVKLKPGDPMYDVVEACKSQLADLQSQAENKGDTPAAHDDEESIPL